MVDVVITKDALEKSKVHAAIIEQVRKKMVENPYPTRPPPGGKKWEELVRLDGAHYAVACRWEGNKILMTRVRKSPTRRVKIRRKRK